MFRILIVEDSFIYRKILRETLQIQFPKVKIIEAKDGEEALKEIEITPPDLIFMDIKLPTGNGLELTKRIKDRYPNIFIVILTSYDLPEYREAASQCNANFFLSKASTTKEGILSLVESILLKQKINLD
jgi:DNA-binding NarL/FixJ family response regulator